MFLNMVILYPTKLHKFFSYSRFAVRHTEKYIIITDMYRIVQYYESVQEKQLKIKLYVASVGHHTFYWELFITKDTSEKL